MVSERPFKSTKNTFQRGDVLYGKLRPYLNKVVIADTKGICTTEIIPINTAPFCSNRYFFYWLKSFQFQSYVNEVSYGVNMPRLGTKDGNSAPFRLFSLPEQKKIAAQLDTLLAQVDKIKTRLDAIPDILKRFRQSVLAAAVSGKLTEEWRGTEQYLPLSEAFVVPVDWKQHSLNDVVEYITSGSRGWAKYYSEAGALFIRSQDINTDELVINDAAFVALPENVEGKRTKVKVEDLLVTITGANVTRCARVKANYDDAYISQHVALIRLRAPSSATFIELVLKAENAGRKQLTSMAYGGGKPGLNLQNLKDVMFAIPPTEEQAEIVRRVDQLFAFADQIETQVHNAQYRVNGLTQSILAKAFLGELTADWRAEHPELISGEHSAEALLARIKAEQATLSAKKTPRTRRKPSA